MMGAPRVAWALASIVDDPTSRTAASAAKANINLRMINPPLPPTKMLTAEMLQQQEATLIFAGTIQEGAQLPKY